jgi:hypothetical protein
MNLAINAIAAIKMLKSGSAALYLSTRLGLGSIASEKTMTCIISTPSGNIVHRVKLSDSTLDAVAEALGIPKRSFQSSKTLSMTIHRSPKKVPGKRKPPSPKRGT